MFKPSTSMSDRPLSDPRVFAYTLDAKNRIVAVNDAWCAFAQENEAAQLTRAAILQRSVWDFIDGPETQSVYDAILQRAHTARVTMRFAFRCDSPEQRRFMEMEISPEPNRHIQIACRIRRIEWRPRISLPATSAHPARRFVSVCSSCRKVELARDRWVEIEEALPLLHNEPDEPIPAISHGFCSPCAEEWFRQIDDGKR